MQWCSKIRNVPSEVRTALCPASERYLPQAKPDRPPPITTTVFALACETHNKMEKKCLRYPKWLDTFWKGTSRIQWSFFSRLSSQSASLSSEPGHSEPWVFPTALWLRRSWPFPQCPWASGSPAHWNHWTMKNIRMPTSNSMKIARNYPSSGTTHSPVPGLTVLNAKSSRKRTVSGRISSVAKFHRDHVGYRMHRIHIDLLRSPSWQFQYHKEIIFLTISEVICFRYFFLHFIFRSAVRPGWRSQSSTWAAELPTPTWAWHSGWSSMFHTQNAKHIKELIGNKWKQLKWMEYSIESLLSKPLSLIHSKMKAKVTLHHSHLFSPKNCHTGDTFCLAVSSSPASVIATTGPTDSADALRSFRDRSGSRGSGWTRTRRTFVQVGHWLCSPSVPGHCHGRSISKYFKICQKVKNVLKCIDD